MADIPLRIGDEIMNAGAISDQCSACKSGISPALASTTQRIYGKPFCAACTPAAQAEADKAAEQFVPPEYQILKDAGWKLDNGFAFKTIDGVGVSINLAKRAEKGKAVEVGGKKYSLGDNENVDAEILALFKKFDAGKNGTPGAMVVGKLSNGNMPVPTNTKLSVETICKYLCPDATEEEAFMFLKLCEHRGLDPWAKEAYLIKYSKTSPASMVVGIDAFLKRADLQKDFLGFEAGIILLDEKGTIIRREGTFRLKTETLVGGWAKVYREGRKPYISEVSLESCIKVSGEGKVTKFWATIPETMIRKTPLARALREAYSSEFSGMYEASEIREVLQEV